MYRRIYCWPRLMLNCNCNQCAKQFYVLHCIPWMWIQPCPSNQVEIPKRYFCRIVELIIGFLPMAEFSLDWLFRRHNSSINNHSLTLNCRVNGWKNYFAVGVIMSVLSHWNSLLTMREWSAASSKDYHLESTQQFLNKVCTHCQYHVQIVNIFILWMYEREL